MPRDGVPGALFGAAGVAAGAWPTGRAASACALACGALGATVPATRRRASPEPRDAAPGRRPAERTADTRGPGRGTRKADPETPTAPPSRARPATMRTTPRARFTESGEQRWQRAVPPGRRSLAADADAEPAAFALR
ncbi:hypothetical protein ACGFYZ_02895 [Streptomyces sp. NPDC048330]|uniref:hypothetical protein n=1 Tax=Streptomyces sp. NPDC048330 TaxID=3365533 RepID=UPI00371CE51C